MKKDSFTPSGVVRSTLRVSLLVLLVGVAACSVGYLPWFNLLCLCSLNVLLLALRRAKWPSLRGLAYLLGALVSAYLAAVYRPVGFSYPVLWEAGVLYAGGSAFSLHGNLGKCLSGLLLLVWLAPFSPRVGEQGMSLTRALTLSLLICCSVFVFVLLGFDLPLLPKWPEGVVIFLLVNLLMTVIPEEAFFRLLLQRPLARSFGARRGLGHAVSLVLVSVIFALVHVPWWHWAIGMYVIAALAYSIVFAVTGRLSMAVLCHFGVNVLHLSLLPYPLQ